MVIDRKRISAVRALEALGYVYRDDEWLPPTSAPISITAEADSMHGVLMDRADALMGCTENSEEEAELKAIVDTIEAYEAKRWPLGKDSNVPGGKG
jgi:hypothetical protein